MDVLVSLLMVVVSFALSSVTDSGKPRLVWLGSMVAVPMVLAAVMLVSFLLSCNCDIC